MIEHRLVPLGGLTPFPGNPRRGNVGLILESLKRNGQYRELVVRRTDDGLTVLAGNHTLAALLRHYEESPDGCADVCALCDAGQADEAQCGIIECDDQRARRINLVDNKASDEAGYDDDALAAMLEQLDDLTGTGYEPFEAVAQMPEVLPEHIPEDIEQDEPVPEPPAVPVTRPGDVWTLGAHRLMCGDSRNADDVATLLDGAEINLAFTSPPYASQREYDTTTEFRPIPPDEYVQWFRPVAELVKDHLAADGSWFVNIKSTAEGLDNQLYVMDLVIAHAREWGWHYVTEFVWRRIGVPKSVIRRFKNQFEPVYQFVINDFKMRPDRVRHESDSVPVPQGPGAGDTSWKDAQGGNGHMFGGQNVTRDTMSDHQGEGGSSGPTGGRHGRKIKRSGIYAYPAQPGCDPEHERIGSEQYVASGLAYPGNMLPTFSGDHQATGHTAAFPVGLPQWFVLVYSDPGDAVYDPFCGSGSTLLACEREGRRGFGMEISPKYCDTAAKRFQQVTGIVPLLNGQSHDLVKAEV